MNYIEPKCPTGCIGEMVKGPNIPLAYCPMCGSFVIYNRENTSNESLPHVLREILCIARGDIILKPMVIPIVIGLCRREFRPLIYLLAQISSSDIVEDLCSAMKKDCRVRYEDFFNVWTDKIHSRFVFDTRDIYYLLESLAYAYEIINTIDEYATVDNINTGQEESDSSQIARISATPQFIEKFQKVIVKWEVNIPIGNKSKKQNRHQRGIKNIVSVELTEKDTINGRIRKLSVPQKGALEFAPEHSTIYIIVFYFRNRRTLSSSINVNVIPQLAIHEFSISPPVISEGQSSRVYWEVEGYKSLTLKLRDDTYREEYVDLTHQPDNKYIFAPNRPVLVTLIAEGMNKVRKEASFHVGVRRLPRFLLSSLPILLPLELSIKPPNIPSLSLPFDEFIIEEHFTPFLANYKFKAKVHIFMNRIRQKLLRLLGY